MAQVDFEQNYVDHNHGTLNHHAADITQIKLLNEIPYLINEIPIDLQTIY